MAFRPRLLAVDLDGTLLRDDGRIDERDAAAIAGARQQGVAVTIATGRLASATVRYAHQLGLDKPMVCADGALLIGPDGEPLEVHSIPLEVTAQIFDRFARGRLLGFLLSTTTVHCDGPASRWQNMVRGWTDLVKVHGPEEPHETWCAKERALMAIAVGDLGSCETTARDLGAELQGRVDVDHFGMGVEDVGAVRCQPPGCSKGTMLASLCGRLGIAAADVAVVGDWLNDLSMFSWAGRSFAMGQSPPHVRAAATDGLQATCHTGGGVAEALDRWLGAAEGGAQDVA